MSTNTNDLAKVLANAVLTTISDDDFKVEAARRGLSTVQPTDDWVLEQVEKRELTGDVLEGADDQDLWDAIDSKTYTVTSNIGEIDEGDVLDALDEDVKERMCRSWVEDNPQEVREILLKRGEPDERDDDWVVAEVFRRGLAADVLRDVADKMRLTY